MFVQAYNVIVWVWMGIGTCFAFSNTCKSLPTAFHLRIRSSATPMHLNLAKNEPPLVSFLDNLSKTGTDNSRVQRDSLVVAKVDIPELGECVWVRVKLIFVHTILF